MPAGGLDAMRQAFDRICKEAEDGVRSGCLHVVLTDANVDADRAALPMILAAGGVHSYLVRQSLRTFISLNVRSAECLDVHYAAVIIGVGATTVNPYLAEETIAARHERGLFGKLSLGQCLANYKKALDDGLLKVMSKMGISVLSSYRGGCNFEAVGLSRSLVQEFFPGMPSRISGIGLRGVQEKIAEQHPARLRRGRDRAADRRLLQDAARRRPAQFRGQPHPHAAGRGRHRVLREVPPLQRRGARACRRSTCATCWTSAPTARRSPLDEVESITELRKRLVAPGISLGALGPEAHETLSIAMNRIGAKSDSGEGGEDPARYRPRANGDNASSAIKQVASGRFGVTAEYLNNCRELEIKVAQGAKPGEGGQLPGLKVSEMIAKLRHSTPGVTLISPPPHHDIYSIEDLAQLIYDLKQINPEARVTVKLVARSGIGTIAAGVAKAKADVILVSGHSGGTGASPADQHQVCRHPLGDGAVGDAPGADAEPPARQGAAAHRRRHQDRPRRGDRRHAGRRGVRHRHGLADRHGLHHGAAVPFQHLPGRRVHAGPQAARQVRGLAGEGGQPLQLHRRGGARDPGPAGLPLAARRSSAAPTC